MRIGDYAKYDLDRSRALGDLTGGKNGAIAPRSFQLSALALIDSLRMILVDE
jgi:hypothetical protein